MPYDQVLFARQLPVGTYVFTDIDRLPLKTQLDAANLFRRLNSADNACQAINDPARVRSRYGLLRALYRNGLNAFNVYRVDEGVKPERFPVFIRFETAHDKVLSDLLPDQQALDVAMQERIADGVPEHALLVIEYCAEPIATDIYRKLSAYRVGSRVFAGESVHDDNWYVKNGQMGGGTSRALPARIGNRDVVSLRGAADAGISNRRHRLRTRGLRTGRWQRAGLRNQHQPTARPT